MDEGTIKIIINLIRNEEILFAWKKIVDKVSIKSIIKLIQEKELLARLTWSPARILKDSMTCSAVSVSVASRVIKSRKDSKVTLPVWLGSTIIMILWKSASPYRVIRTKSYSGYMVDHIIYINIHIYIYIKLSIWISIIYT